MTSSPAIETERAPRLLVVGCGGIGGVVAAHLFEQGHDVTALTTNALIADAVNRHGFRVRGESSPGTVRGRAVQRLAASERPFDFVLLATQPPQVEQAARDALSALAPDGAMVCFQNGLCEERVAAIAGPDRTLGAIVAWGASMVEPGVYDRTSAGGFVLGTITGSRHARADELARILEAIGPTTVTDNLTGARWSKLAINCAISSLGTLGGERLGALMRYRFVRRLCLEIMTETVAVARALGVRLEKVSGTLDLDWIALTDADRAAAASPSLVAKHALLLAVGARFRRLRSSMLAAIERGRPPAIDFLNGEVAVRGAALGIATPMSTAIREQVLAIARGEAKPSIETLRAFFDRTRGLSLSLDSLEASVLAPSPPPQVLAMGGDPPSPPPQASATVWMGEPANPPLTPAAHTPPTGGGTVALEIMPTLASAPDGSGPVASVPQASARGAISIAVPHGGGTTAMASAATVAMASVAASPGPSTQPSKETEPPSAPPIPPTNAYGATEAFTAFDPPPAPPKAPGHDEGNRS